MSKAGDPFGFQHYREGGIERIGEASLLLRAGQFAGSIYLAGRGVEGILRALVWKTDAEVRQGKKSLDTGHDLRELLLRVSNLGLLTGETGRDDLQQRVQRAARLWYNHLRFASTRFIETRWRNVGEFGKGRRFRTFKEAVAAYFDDCSAIIKRCEILCASTS